MVVDFFDEVCDVEVTPVESLSAKTVPEQSSCTTREWDTCASLCTARVGRDDDETR